MSHGGTTYSQGYTLSDIRLLADMCSLSGELQESYNAALLNGTSLKMPIKSWECLTNYLSADSGGSFDVAISKSYTRLATLFALFNQNPPVDNSGKAKIVNTNYFPTAQSEDVSYHWLVDSIRAYIRVDVSGYPGNNGYPGSEEFGCIRVSGYQMDFH